MNGKIEVVCAVIEKENRILATRRSSGMSHSGKWEFPGGKIKPNEQKEDSLHREIREELEAKIEIVHPLNTVYHDMHIGQLVLYPYICRLRGGYQLNEHDKALWLSTDELYQIDWLPADVYVLKQYELFINNFP
ncbi:MAG TPA: 8-oxo-dGTP diphosphatase MutT [Cytophagales bacterium]|jgi:8-oxo-dGTP diphosphatase|nr:8-oxo-dGTP diphosphatase MutT [Cytophagales bacterium]